MLYHQDSFLMAQSLDSQGERETVVNIDNENDCGRRTEDASQFDAASSSCKLPGSSKVSKVSFEDVVVEAVRQKNKDFPGKGVWQTFSSSGEEEGLKNSSNYYSRKNSWVFAVEKTKSKWIFPEEHYQGVFRQEDEQEEDDTEDIPEKHKSMKHNTCTILQLVSLVLIIGALGCSLLVPFLRRQTLWDLSLWKWEMLVLSLICGRLVSGWVIRIVVNFIESSRLNKWVLYFVYGLRKTFQHCLWLGMVLLVWHCIFNDSVENQTKSKVLPYVSKILVCFLVSALIWPLKSLVVEVIASIFHLNTFFERIQEALFSQYVIQTLSGSGQPLLERYITREERKPINEANDASGLMATLLKEGSKIKKSPQFSRTMSKKQQTQITIDDLHNLKQMILSARSIKRVISIVRNGDLSTLDEQMLNSDKEDESLMGIRSESQAEEAATKIFNKVAKPGSRYVYLDDLMRFMGKDEAVKTMRLCGEAYANEGISEASLNNWLVNAFKDRRALALSLKYTKTAVDELHNMINILVAVIIVKIWLMILGIPIMHFLVFVSSQLILAAVIFGNTSKTVFEAIVFFFVMHPFDVGDKCEVDGVMMTVEEMNILTTVFLRHDNQKTTYPNSVLATKHICNFNRSPDITEKIEFCVHISTPMEKISMLKERIIRHVEKNKQHWQQGPAVFVKDVEDMNRVNVSVWITHTLNFQRTTERWIRRGLLLEEMIKIFKDLEIEHRMLPLDVNVRNLPALPSTTIM